MSRNKPYSLNCRGGAYVRYFAGVLPQGAYALGNFVLVLLMRDFCQEGLCPFPTEAVQRLMRLLTVASSYRAS